MIRRDGAGLHFPHYMSGCERYGFIFNVSTESETTLWISPLSGGSEALGDPFADAAEVAALAGDGGVAVGPDRTAAVGLEAVGDGLSRGQSCLNN